MIRTWVVNGFQTGVKIYLHLEKNIFRVVMYIILGGDDD
jgi:hypothetical protein